MIEQTRICVTENGIFPTGNMKFKGEIFSGTHYKIYIVKFCNDFLYVGKTTQAIGARFRGNFSTYRDSLKKNNGLKNYSYKWIKEFVNSEEELDLYVFRLQATYDDIAESIEAELVFLIRKEKGYWPKFQHEIHFRNSEKAKEIALEIYNQII